MTVPTVLAALMLAVAAYCAIRPFAAGHWHRSSEYDVDLAHAGKGLVMAAMLAERLTAGVSGPLAVVFAIVAAWFAGRMVQARRQRTDAPAGRPQDSGSHHGTHLVSCGAMAFMLLAASATGTHAAAAPSLALGFMLLLACALVLATGTLAAGRGAPAAASAGLMSVPRLCPRLASCCQIAMGAVMIYMLVQMI